MATATRNWSDRETKVLIDVFKQHDIMSRLDGRKFKNSELYAKVHSTLVNLNVDRSVIQIQHRWKWLKAGYFKAKTASERSGASPAKFVFFEEMKELLGGRPLSNPEGVDVGMGGEEVDVNLQDTVQEETDNELSSDEQEDSMEDENSADQSLSNPAGKKPKATVASGYQRALQTWSTEQRTVLEEIQRSNLQKVEALQEKAREHEQRMFMAFMEENTCSNERLLTHLFEGLRGMLSPTPAQGVPPPNPPQHPHPHPHLYPHPMMSHPYPPLHTPTPSNVYPRALTPEYIMHDLDVDK